MKRGTGETMTAVKGITSGDRRHRDGDKTDGMRRNEQLRRTRER